MSKRHSSRQARHRTHIAQGKPACHICGQAINYELRWPDPWCYVVDHLVPIDKGGPDTLDNKRAAHNTCNSKKRARDYAPIVRRSGALS